MIEEFTIGDLRFQESVYENITSSSEFKKYEIVDEEEILPLAVFQIYENKYRLVFIEDRPFKYHNPQFFMEFAKICARLLDIQVDAYKLEQKYE